MNLKGFSKKRRVVCSPPRAVQSFVCRFTFGKVKWFTMVMRRHKSYRKPGLERLSLDSTEGKKYNQKHHIMMTKYNNSRILRHFIIFNSF